MAVILNIETSTDYCSAAVCAGGEVMSYACEQGQNIHAEKLTVFIDNVMREAGVPLKNLDAVAVGKGPGSYTGLRIGVSTAKGLAFALGIPLLAIDTLKILAAGFYTTYGLCDKNVVAMLDARRMEVYMNAYNNRLEALADTKAEILTEGTVEKLQEYLPAAVVGNGAVKLQGLMAYTAADIITENLADAKFMAQLSLDAYNREDFVDTAYFEPYYLKEFVATKSTKKLL